MLLSSSRSVYKLIATDLLTRRSTALVALPSPTDVGADMSGTDSNSGFSFDTSVLNPHGPRSIKSTIWWVPQSFRWAVCIQKAKKDAVIPSSDDFCVNQLLTGDEFNEERERRFIEAATAWNKLDGSKRPRILLPDVAASS